MNAWQNMAAIGLFALISLGLWVRAKIILKRTRDEAWLDGHACGRRAAQAEIQAEMEIYR